MADLSNRRFLKTHEWIQKTEEGILIGISDYAQNALGNIVFVDLPEAGASFDQGEELVTLESVKSVSPVYMPFSGEVVKVNEELLDRPELLNEDCYENWIALIRTDAYSEDELLEFEAYEATLKEDA